MPEHVSPPGGEDNEAQQAVLTLPSLDRDTAYTLAALLGDVLEPAADAVSIFEEASGPDWRVDAYFQDRDSGNAGLDQLRQIVVDADVWPQSVTDALDHAAVDDVADLNWVAMSQAALPPVQAGRFTICGAHDLDRVPSGPGTIVVEAGEAFGTAHHATTFGCLLALDRLTRQRSYRNVLDLGTGSGVLALALARALPHAKITATDIDVRSIEVARENASRNGNTANGSSSGMLRFQVADGVKAPSVRSAAPFDLIVANILAGPLLGLAPALASVAAPGSTLVLSGILVAQAREIIARYRSLGFDTTHHARLNGWSTLTMTRRTSQPASRVSQFNVFMLPDE